MVSGMGNKKHETQVPSKALLVVVIPIFFLLMQGTL